MVRTKVFVGNLSFKTTEAELSEHFKVSGTVVGANIITRGPRSLGYGFVELESEEDANNAVKLMNKKEIDGRQINVEVAKPREEEESAEQNNNNTQQATRGRGGRGGSRGAMRGANPLRGSAPRGRGVPRRRFRPRNQEGTEEADQTQGQQTTNAPVQQGSPQQTQSPRGGRGLARGRGSRGRGRGARISRPPIEERANTPSKTSLFVANLPFSLDDEGFGKVFSESGLKYKSAYVVRKRNGHSKGFGFVEFDNEEDQQKALQLNNKKIGAPGSERELIIKIALTETKDREGQTEEKEVKTEQKTETKKVEEKKPQGGSQPQTPEQKKPEAKKTPEKKEEPKKVDSPKTQTKKEDPKK